jgi:hypothetical protein
MIGHQNCSCHSSEDMLDQGTEDNLWILVAHGLFKAYCLFAFLKKLKIIWNKFYYYFTVCIHLLGNLILMCHLFHLVSYAVLAMF